MLLPHSLQLSPVCPDLSCTLLPLLINQEKDIKGERLTASGMVISFYHCLLEKPSLKTKISQASLSGWPWGSKREESSVSLLWASVLCPMNVSCWLLALFSLFSTVLGHACVRQQIVLHSGSKCQLLQLSHKPLQLFMPGVGINEQGGATEGGQGDSARCLFHDCLWLAHPVGLEWFTWPCWSNDSLKCLFLFSFCRHRLGLFCFWFFYSRLDCKKTIKMWNIVSLIKPL